MKWHRKTKNKMRKLVLHIPHASTAIPMYDGYLASPEQFEHEILKLTDWYTDDLFQSPIDDQIIAPFSRIFCDVERFADDAQEVMAQYGMGVLYQTLDDGNPLRVVTSNLRESILQNYYWEHHNKLEKTVEQHLEETGICLIVDCHSFPSTPFKRALVQTPDTPDFNIGTDSFHTPTNFIEASIDFFESRGYTLGINTPYDGSIVPLAHYQKEPRVHSIMLEVNRRMYMDETNAEKSAAYLKTKDTVQDYLKLLKSL